MLLMFAKFLRAGMGLLGLRAFALATAMALASLPTGAWAKSNGEDSPPALQIRSNATALSANAAPKPDDKDYASREAKAKGLEKFEGGSTTIVLAAGGGTLLVVLIVVLIIVIL